MQIIIIKIDARPMIVLQLLYVAPPPKTLLMWLCDVASMLVKKGKKIAQTLGGSRGHPDVSSDGRNQRSVGPTTPILWLEVVHAYEKGVQTFFCHVKKML